MTQNRLMIAMAQAQQEMSDYAQNLNRFAFTVRDIAQHYVSNVDIEFFGSHERAEETAADGIDVECYRHNTETTSATLEDIMIALCEIAKKRLSNCSRDKELEYLYRAVMRMRRISSAEAIQLADNDMGYATEYIRQLVDTDIAMFTNCHGNSPYRDILVRLGEYVFNYC